MKRIVKLITGSVLAMCSSAWAGVVSGVSQEVEMTILPNGAEVTKSVLVQCPLLGAESVSTRQGTMTVAGNTVTVFQHGRRMKLATYEEKSDWYTHVIPLRFGDKKGVFKSSAAYAASKIRPGRNGKPAVRPAHKNVVFKSSRRSRTAQPTNPLRLFINLWIFPINYKRRIKRSCFELGNVDWKQQGQLETTTFGTR